MRTNIDLDDNLLREAHRLSKLKTNKEVVNRALDFYVKYLKRKDMLALAGKVAWEGDIEQMRKV